MKISKLVLVLLLAASAFPAMAANPPAQNGPSDVRCLLLSNGFSKSANNEQARQAAAQTLIFYIGRLDGRMAPGALEAAMRAQAASIDPKAAGPEMTACAARLAHAQQTIQALGRAAAPAAPPK
jgi:hypothetical protein